MTDEPSTPLNFPTHLLPHLRPALEGHVRTLRGRREDLERAHEAAGHSKAFCIIGTQEALSGGPLMGEIAIGVREIDLLIQKTDDDLEGLVGLLGYLDTEFGQ